MTINPKSTEMFLNSLSALSSSMAQRIDYNAQRVPAFNALWNFGIYFRSAYFEDTGKWKPPNV